MLKARNSTLASHATDLDLVQAALLRDRKAAARLVELHADAVHAYVWRRLAPKVDMVDDLTQEVFLAAWRGLDSFTGAAPLRNWLLSIARHKVEDYYRRTLAAVCVPVDGDEESEPGVALADLDGDMDAAQKARKVAKVISELPYEYAIVLRWRYWEDRSAREMAQATGRTEKAIERLVARARAKFREQWEMSK